MEPTPAQVDALYRLAEIFLASEARRKQGFELLERAFSAEPRWAQAGRLLKAAATHDANDEKVMAMYERVARNGGDGELLLDFLERRAGLPAATPAQIREAVDLAVDHGGVADDLGVVVEDEVNAADRVVPVVVGESLILVRPEGDGHQRSDGVNLRPGQLVRREPAQADPSRIDLGARVHARSAGPAYSISIVSRSVAGAAARSTAGQ